MRKVLVVSRSFGKYSKEPEELLQKNGFEILRADSLEEVELSDVDALILGTAKLKGEKLRSSGVKIIARNGVGVDNVDLNVATELGIPVTITPGANTVAVAEFTIALIFTLARRIVEAHNVLWKERLFVPPAGVELSGKTLGIIGFGAIGKEVARRALCLGMTVIAHDPYVDEVEFAKLSVEKVDLDTLLRDSDFVSLHVPLNESTKNLINERELSLMKSTAMIINTSRGGVINERALVEALKSKKIAGAALDTFAVEPLPGDSELYNCPNLILTPHAGAHTLEAINRMNMMAAKSIVDFFNGVIPKHVANKEVLGILKKRFSERN
ncbi:MAG: D-3-phosphoglycerate dehydrogenase / 2-oxoglutarate reductase [Thermotogota bacterium]|nr:D-3-phosphoglycerate dehydrogenase / 2-oxoglutarate reductase [Thermotogota bacterium]